jgi:hypothetical protein
VAIRRLPPNDFTFVEDYVVRVVKWSRLYKLISKVLTSKYHHHYRHHQPINVPTAGAQAFLIDYPQRERAITHYAGQVRIGG